MKLRESYEDCIKEWHRCQKQTVPRTVSNANAKAQIVKQSRLVRRLLCLLQFQDDMRRINPRDVEESIRQSSKRVRELLDAQRGA